MKILDMLRSSSGQFELNRVVGAVGALSYIAGANGFEAWNMHRGVAFDITAYCLAFPGGLAVAVGAIAGAVAWKDKGVAVARTIAETGAVPAAPPDGPKVPVQSKGD